MENEFLELNELIKLIAEKKVIAVTQFHNKAVTNCIYVAIKGTTYDGAEFIPDALDRGASYIVGEFEDIAPHLRSVCSRPLGIASSDGCAISDITTNNCAIQEVTILDKKIHYYKVSNARKAISYLCSKLYALEEENVDSIGFGATRSGKNLGQYQRTKEATKPISSLGEEEADLREEESERARSDETRSGTYRDVREHQRTKEATKPISLSSRVVAVTGTNGKTSVANFYAQLANLSGFDSMSIGTMGGLHFTKNIPKLNLNLPNLTTPSAEDLYSAIKTCLDNKIKFISIEASSHGLDQYRLEYIDFAAVGFTNLSHDHLDYHHTMEDYFAAKRRLFSDVQAKVAVLNADVPEYQSLKQASEASGKLVVDYGYQASNLKLVDFKDGEYFTLSFNGKTIKIKTRLVGLFQIYNLLCAFGMFVYGEATNLKQPDNGINLDLAFECLANIRQVPGRLELIANFKGASIYVDYAHTPDALELVLKELGKTIANQGKGRLITIFGCGGDRDKTKRPIMGQVASQLSDIIIITDDNPRSEEAAQIRAEIISGIELGLAKEPFDCGSLIEIGDRLIAIKTALNLLQPEDVLLIAGKGHEDYQIIGNSRLNFSDREAVLSAINLEQKT